MLWLNRNDFVFNNKIIPSPQRTNLLPYLSIASLDGSEYKHGQGGAGVNVGGNQVTGA
jgi:hypothetical protein